MEAWVWFILAVGIWNIIWKSYGSQVTPWINEFFRGFGRALIMILLVSAGIIAVVNFLMSFAEPYEYRQTLSEVMRVDVYLCQDLGLCGLHPEACRGSTGWPLCYDTSLHESIG